MSEEKRSPIAALARRLHRAWKDYQRRYPGRSVPISDTFSRILSHDPTYIARNRKRTVQRAPLRNPGVFTLQRIANDLETTVGYLLGESGFEPTVLSSETGFTARILPQGMVGFIAFIEEIPALMAWGVTRSDAERSLKKRFSARVAYERSHGNLPGEIMVIWL